MRYRLWLASVIAALGLYAVRATHLPRRTAVGVERRVLAGSGYAVLNVPVDNRWLVCMPPRLPDAQLNPWAWPTSALRNLEWPPGRVTGRRLRPFREHGTWAMDDLGLRRVWRYRATSIQSGHILSDYDWMMVFTREVEEAVVDLRTRRTLTGTAAARTLHSLEVAEGYYSDALLVGIGSVAEESYGLEGIDAEFTVPLDVRIGNLTITLWQSDSDTPAGTMFGITDQPTPRVLRLAENAAPTAISADGRIVFFERDNALWRLDLRRPLPGLLDEAAPPPLPELSP